MILWLSRPTYNSIPSETNVDEIIEIIMGKKKRLVQPKVKRPIAIGGKNIDDKWRVYGAPLVFIESECKTTLGQM